jgi:Putative zinc-finger
VTGCRDLRPLIGAYVLGALEPSEAEQIRAHVATCPACAAEHTRLAPLPGLLTLAEGATRATEEPLPPALEERVLDAVAAETPRRRRRRRVSLGWARRALPVATVLAAAAVAVAVVVSSTGGPEYGPEIPLRAAAAPRGAWAEAELRPVAGGTAMHLRVAGLPADPKAVYEVHCDSPGWSASAGTFRVDRDGAATVVLTTAARRGQYDHIRVLRRTGGAPRVVFVGALS